MLVKLLKGIKYKGERHEVGDILNVDEKLVEEYKDTMMFEVLNIPQEDKKGTSKKNTKKEEKPQEEE